MATVGSLGQRSADERLEGDLGDLTITRIVSTSRMCRSQVGERFSGEGWLCVPPYEKTWPLACNPGGFARSGTRRVLTSLGAVEALPGLFDSVAGFRVAVPSLSMASASL